MAVSYFKRAASIFLLAVFLSGATCANDREAQIRRGEIHYDLGVAHMEANRFREAMMEFEVALKEDEENPRAHAALALIYHSMGKYNEAITHYEAAIKHDPTFTDAYNNLGSVYVDQGRYEKAIPLFEKAVADLYYRTPYLAEQNLGWALYKTGKADEGIKHIKKSLVINPKFCLGHRNLGQIYDEQNKCPDALKHYSEYAKYCAEEQLAQYQSGLLEAKCGDSARAVAALQQCGVLDAETDLGKNCIGLVKKMGGVFPPPATGTPQATP